MGQLARARPLRHSPVAAQPRRSAGRACKALRGSGEALQRAPGGGRTRDIPSRVWAGAGSVKDVYCKRLPDLSARGSKVLTFSPVVRKSVTLKIKHDARTLHANFRLLRSQRSPLGLEC